MRHAAGHVVSFASRFGGLLCAATWAAALVLAPTESAVRFADALEGSGIDFRHHFLPSEQGENYRMNMYDHGSGVAVADVNGDGLPDIYLLDFLGPNALYINRGGFKFEDIARKVGVDMPEDVSGGGCFGDCDNG